MNHARSLHSMWISSLLLPLFLAAPSLYAAEETQRLVLPDIPVGNEYDFSQFGEGLDLEDNRLAVGAPGLETEAVYVFEYQDGEWVDVAKVVSPVEEDVAFGSRVAFDENILAISAPEANIDGVQSAGAVYVYEQGADNSEWRFRERLTTESPITEAHFGGEIVADSGRLAVVAQGANATVYLFEYEPETESWSQVLESSGLGPDSDSDVDLSGDTLVHRRSPDRTVLLYERVGSEWQLMREFTAPTGIDAVGIDGDVLAVGEIGASSYDDPPRHEGMVHIYERANGQWTQVASVQHEAVPTYLFASRVTVRDGLVAGGERPENGGIDIFGKDANGDWIYLTTVHAGTSRFSYYRFDLTRDAIAISNPVHGPHVAVTDISDSVPETDDGDTGDDGDGGEGDTGDGDTGDGGGGDDDTGNDNNGDTDTGDGGTDDGDEVGDDNSEGVVGDDEGDGGDDGGTGEGETGGDGTEGGDETGGDETPPRSDSGGGALSWIMALLLVPLGYTRKFKRSLLV